MALIKRFKVPDDLEGDTARGGTSIQEERELDALFQELESLSCGDGEDSGQDMDNVSVGSTPKPSLRPFFLTDKNNEIKSDITANEVVPSVETDLPLLSDALLSGSPPKEKEAMSDRKSRIFRTSSGTPANKKKQNLNFSTTEHLPSLPKSTLEACLSPTNVEPRKTFLDQLSRIFIASEANVLPEVVILVGPQEPHGGTSSPNMGIILSMTFKTTFSLQNTAEVKAILSALMNRIQK